MSHRYARQASPFARSTVPLIKFLSDSRKYAAPTGSLTRLSMNERTPAGISFKALHLYAIERSRVATTFKTCYLCLIFRNRLPRDGNPIAATIFFLSLFSFSVFRFLFHALLLYCFKLSMVFHRKYKQQQYPSIFKDEAPFAEVLLTCSTRW